ncbi:MAG: DUF429 domain-containing protein [Armatimonadetes bacterium]|nr:DUF429 domain-containing protein [Armatimonadota bacterium]MBX3107787.1 DUF429 domain-containing protein [Fimbriimonadaceae bacterium]
MNQVVAGIDVAGKRRGFHIAILDTASRQVIHLGNVHDPGQAARLLLEFDSLACIAIDCPPKAEIVGPKSREAERALSGLGFRMQWTRRPENVPPEWMVNGEILWESIATLIPQVKVIETFPTAVSRQLGDCDFILPLKLLEGGVAKREGYKDFVDACLCAWVAERYLLGQAKPYGLGDELGPIWV